MLKQFKKLITIILIFGLLFFRVAPAMSYEIPVAPTPPTAPTAPVAPTPPSAPQAPSAPEAPSSTENTPTPPPAPTGEEPDNNNDEESNDTAQSNNGSSNEAPASSTLSNSGQVDGNSNSNDSQPAGEQTGGQNVDGQVGSATVDTGSIDNTAGVSTLANTNLSAGVAGSDPGSVSVVNSGNGTDSTNNGSVGIVDNSNTFQNNSAVVTNNLDQSALTGDNSASGNVGNSAITTGDANVSGTVVTAVNTNIDGIGVAEFSVVDDHVGDIILDFNAGCIYGCDVNNLTVKNAGNGASSINDAAIEITTNNLTVQTNDALIESNLDLSANSGDNNADKNTGGNSAITTGDANVAGNALTFANNNLVGGAYFNFVYIYGDLIGDIIMPEDYLASVLCDNCGNDILAMNTGNGANSTNTASVGQATNDNTFQTNDALIENNLSLDATTGDNETSKNTGGNSSIRTGDTDINAQVLNIANSNTSGEDWWLVLVNEAGNWIGKILGAPSGGGNYAGSGDTQFSVDENGIITAVNSGNGSNSNNNSTISETTNNTTVQNNTAKIVNNMDLSANTGGNSASYNTGGNSEITTGDADIIASIVNMVNNNFSGGGRLFVTVIDVFGSWTGNFLTPGAEKELQPLAQNQASDGQPALSGQGNTGGNQTSNQQSNTGSTQGVTNSINGQVAGASQNGNQAGFNPGLWGSNSDNSNFIQGGEGQSGDSLLAGNDKQPQTGVRSAKKIKINLAWLLLGIPVPIFGFMRYRRSLSSHD